MVPERRLKARARWLRLGKPVAMKSGISPETLAELAEKFTRLTAFCSDSGIFQIWNGLSSRKTAVRDVRPEKKEGGMEEKRLLEEECLEGG